MSHHTILKSSHMWLDDAIVSATQFLLKNKYVHIRGLQPPILAQKLALTRDPQPSQEFIQVLCASGSHWIMVSTVRCPANTINVYDSMNLRLSSTNEKVIADLLRCTERDITVNYVQVQYQSGGSDCGLFALAFATSWCRPSKCYLSAG